MNTNQQMIKMQDKYLGAAAEFVKFLEKQQSAVNDIPAPLAREAVARDAGVSSGTIFNLRNGRLKGIGAKIYERLRSAAERELEAEIKRLEHKLAVTRAARLGLPQNEVGKVQALLEEARRLLQRHET